MSDNCMLAQVSANSWAFIAYVLQGCQWPS